MGKEENNELHLNLICKYLLYIFIFFAAQRTKNKTKTFKVIQQIRHTYKIRREEEVCCLCVMRAWWGEKIKLDAKSFVLCSTRIMVLDRLEQKSL